MWGQSASTLNYYAQYKTGHQINASLGDGSFLSFINTGVFSKSLFLFHAALKVLNAGHVPTSQQGATVTLS